LAAGRYADMEHVRLMKDEITPLASPAFVREHGPFETPQDLASLPLSRSPLEPRRTWFAANGLDWPEPVEGSQFNDIGLMCDGAAAGMGVGLIRREAGCTLAGQRLAGAAVCPQCAQPPRALPRRRTGAMDRWKRAAFAEWLEKSRGSVAPAAFD